MSALHAKVADVKSYFKNDIAMQMRSNYSMDLKRHIYREGFGVRLRKYLHLDTYLIHTLIHKQDILVPKWFTAQKKKKTFKVLHCKPTTNNYNNDNNKNNNNNNNNNNKKQQIKQTLKTNKKYYINKHCKRNCKLWWQIMCFWTKNKVKTLQQKKYQT